MSQFIQLPTNMPYQAPAILKCIKSKVIQPFSNTAQQFTKTNKFWLTQKQLTTDTFKKFYKNKTDKRYVQEMKLADNLQHIIIGKQYQTMKRNLTKYGKSKSLRTEKLMLQKRPQYFQLNKQSQKQNIIRRTSSSVGKPRFPSSIHCDIVPMLKKQQKHNRKHNSLKSVSNSRRQNQYDRVVFVDRKYNTQFSIKLTSLIEAQQISIAKQNYINFLKNYRVQNPLRTQANKNINRKKYQSSYEKENKEAIGLIQIKNNKKMYYQPLRRSQTKHQFVPITQNSEENNKIIQKRPLLLQTQTNNQSKTKKFVKQGQGISLLFKKRSQKINKYKIGVKFVTFERPTTTSSKQFSLIN